MVNRLCEESVVIPSIFPKFAGKNWSEMECLNTWKKKKTTQIRFCMLTGRVKPVFWSWSGPKLFLYFVRCFLHIKYNWISRSSSATDSPHIILASHLKPWYLTDVIVFQSSCEYLNTAKTFKTAALDLGTLVPSKCLLHASKSILIISDTKCQNLAFSVFSFKITHRTKTLNKYFSCHLVSENVFKELRVFRTQRVN